MLVDVRWAAMVHLVITPVTRIILSCQPAEVHENFLIFLSVAVLSVVGVLELPSCRVNFPLPLDPGCAKSRKVYFNYTNSFPIFVTHGSNQTSVIQEFLHYVDPLQNCSNESLETTPLGQAFHENWLYDCECLPSQVQSESTASQNGDYSEASCNDRVSIPAQNSMAPKNMPLDLFPLNFHCA